jgi:hypothetical protein
MAEKLTIKEVNDKVEKLSGNVEKLAELLSKKEEKPVNTPKETVDNSITGSSNYAEVHPVHDKNAREILGDAMERTYMTFPKGGGTLFTVVIKKEFSNAPKDYLARMHEDHRTCNLEVDRFKGEDGAKRWCLLIKQNLKLQDKKII